MRWTQTLIPTLKEAPQEAESLAHTLMLRAGLVRMLMAGVYSYLPLGFRALFRIEAIIREEMEKAGAVELLLPALQPLELWQRTGRDQLMGEVMVRFKDRKGRTLVLGPTHEEVITDLVRAHVSSYKQLPLVLYQIQTKFRDEIRPRCGVVRACEFIMKDAYSFDRDQAGLEANYRAMHDAYLRIFKRLGLSILAVEADSGVMGGSVSHEFMVPCASGEDMVYLCPKCQQANSVNEKPGAGSCPACGATQQKVNVLEIGHIFQLGTKYSQSLGAQFLDAQGKLQPVIMGCYGIGVSRLMAAIIEQNNDEFGIAWPREVSPYDCMVMPLEAGTAGFMEKALGIYEMLQGKGINCLLDDRDERPGVKFKDADLIGITVQVIIGKASLKGGTIEIKIRQGSRKENIPEGELASRIQGIVRG